MSKFSIDYDNLSETVSKRKYKLSDVAHKLEKVAFDVVRFKDADTDELWQVQNADDGDYIVALYDTEEVAKKASKSNWEIVISGQNDLNVFYKGEAIVKLASSKLGIDKQDVESVRKYLPAKLATNKELVKALLKEVSATVRIEILKKYPELSIG